METVGIKALRRHLSEYLRRARQGERIVVTDHGKPVVVLAPAAENAEVRLAWEMVRDSVASWGGGKPKGSADPPRVRGKAASEIVLEDRS